MREHVDIHMATVCLERNRWGSREPSLRVSDWLPRFEVDGFDGIELWENHFLEADPAEQVRLVDAAPAVAVYNSYAGFTDDDTDARAQSAAAVARLSASAVKYNLGGDPARRGEYRRNLLAWAEQLEPACRLLCECHAGTVLERVEDAVTFFADLDPSRFAIITHVAGDAGGLGRWFSAFESRIQHLHVQLRGPDMDPAVSANRERLDACFAVPRAHGFEGSATIEFTRGIGRDEEMETLYSSARMDLAYCREQLSGTRRRDAGISGRPETV